MSEREGIFRPDQRTVLRLCIAAGLAAFAVGLWRAPHRAWAGLLLGNFYFLSLALAGAVFLAVQYAAGAGWFALLKRIPEAMTAYLPVGAGLVGLLGLCGLRDLYVWANPATASNDPILLAKAAFLNVPGYLLTAAVCLLLWHFLIRGLVANSQAQDDNGDLAYTAKNARLSCIFLVVFALTFSLVSMQWLMSLEPHWYSTIYPWYLFGGIFVNAVAVMTLLLLLLRHRGLLPEVRAGHLHDLGEYLFAFSALWAYLWFSQYLLIWYSNIPEETVHYAARFGPGWNILFWANPVVNFIVPFILLLEERSKKDERRLLAATLVLIAGHWLDLYLLVFPAILPRPLLGFIELGMFLGLAAAFLLRFDQAFRRAPPIPSRDPFLGESLHH